jgi:hypothetical protein
MEMNEDKTQFQVDRMLPNMLNAELKGMVVDLANLRSLSVLMGLESLSMKYE